jgi:hypothetical protein
MVFKHTLHIEERKRTTLAKSTFVSDVTYSVIVK